MRKAKEGEKIVTDQLHLLDGFEKIKERPETGTISVSSACASIDRCMVERDLIPD
jgi:hypothetical protein